MPGDTRNKRTEKQKEADRLYVAEQLIKAYSVRTICKMLNEHNKSINDKAYTLSHGSIAADIKKILNEWRDERKDTIDLVVDRELKKLDVIEGECWVAWEKSKTPKETTRTNTENEEATKDRGDGRDKSGRWAKVTTIESTNGDARYFDKIIQCMDRRKELLGYAAPKKVEFSGSVGVGVTPMDEATVLKEKERILNNMTVVKKIS